MANKKALRFTFRNKSRPADRSRYRVYSETPITESDAFEAFKAWADKHMISFVGSGRVVDIPYSDWRIDRQK